MEKFGVDTLGQQSQVKTASSDPVCPVPGCSGKVVDAGWNNAPLYRCTVHGTAPWEGPTRAVSRR